jgi:hypothetical protein
MSMAGRISMGAQREVVAAVTERYRSAKRAEKGHMLDARVKIRGGFTPEKASGSCRIGGNELHS